MKTSSIWTWFLFAGIAAGSAIAQSNVDVTVVGERVNIRARPTLQAEVVGQVSNGDVLTAVTMTDEWVQIVPPKSITSWVYRDFVKNGEVTAPKLKVRAGPGFAYSEVGMLEKGNKVAVHREQQEWLEIETPPRCPLWVGRKYVQPLPQATAAAPAEPASIAAAEPQVEENPTPAPAAVQTDVPLPPPFPVDLPPAAKVTPAPPPVVPSAPAKASAPIPTSTPKVERSLPPPKAAGTQPPADLVKRGLIPVEGQGKPVKVEGVLRRAGYLFGPPGKYRLVEPDNGHYRTVCYLKGGEDRLESLVGARVAITGRQYWLVDAHDSVVVPEKIETQ